MPAVKKARIHSVSLFFLEGEGGWGEGLGEGTIQSNHQSLIGD